jgi:hypothetical protein
MLHKLVLSGKSLQPVARARTLLLALLIVFTLAVAVKPTSVAFACEGSGSSCYCPGC